jgi:type IV pilus assembly protein PilC
MASTVLWNWEGRTRTGEVKKGTIEAETEEAAVARLRVDQITVTKVKKQPKALSLSFGGSVKEENIVVFTRQFATMIDAGLPLVQCLEILSTQTENRFFGKILADVKNTVEGGETFSNSLKRHPKIFDELFVNLVAAGEIGGILDTILQRLSNYIEKAMKLKRQVKGAMVYPIGVLCVAALVISVLLLKVIPVFEKMFKDFGAKSLPAPTEVVIGISRGFAANFHYFVIAFFVLSWGARTALKREHIRNGFDRVVLKMPVIGSLVRKIAVARFTRTLGTLLSSGVPILDSLDIVAKTAGNRAVKAAILHARSKISEGKDLATPLGETKVFPPMVIQMVGVGEQTGAMDTMLQKIADFYEDEVDVAVGALTSLMEPVMMVFLGGIVGGLIVAMYLPIFEIAGNIKAG